jgi:hypothetical protein
MVPALSWNHRKFRPRAQGARGIFMVPPYQRMPFQQGVEWTPPEAAGARGSRPAPLWARREGGRVDPVGSSGAGVGPDHRETGVLALHRRVYRRGHWVMSDTEIGPLLPRGSFGPVPRGAPRRVTMRRHSPGRAFACVDARAQALLRSAMPRPLSCWRWSGWSSLGC